MHRLNPILRRGALRPSTAAMTTRAALPLSLHASPYTTSAPKSSEGASAESGGSRSKTAAENATGSGPDTTTVPDSLSESEVLGRTGGGSALDASSSNAPPRPKVSNHLMPQGKDRGLSREQQEEVDEHNKDFEAKHDRANPAENDKVDDKFWGGRDAGSKD